MTDAREGRGHIATDYEAKDVIERCAAICDALGDAEFAARAKTQNIGIATMAQKHYLKCADAIRATKTDAPLQDGLYAALDTLVKTLDEAHRETQRICTVAAIHGAPYFGPSWREELEAARKALKARPSASPPELVDALVGALERIASDHISAEGFPQGHVYHADCDACHRQEIAAAALTRAKAAPVDAWRDVVAERRRQVEAEGWTPEHDDEHANGELALAAACYSVTTYPQAVGLLGFWPWGMKWWKPTDRRRNLVKAAALILAEIERIDRRTTQGDAEGAEIAEARDAIG